MFSCDDKLLLTLSSLVAGHNCTCGHTNAHRLCISVTHCLEMKFEGHVCFLWDSECLFGLPVYAHIHWVVKKNAVYTLFVFRIGDFVNRTKNSKLKKQN